MELYRWFTDDNFPSMTDWPNPSKNIPSYGLLESLNKFVRVCALLTCLPASSCILLFPAAIETGERYSLGCNNFPLSRHSCLQIELTKSIALRVLPLDPNSHPSAIDFSLEHCLYHRPLPALPFSSPLPPPPSSHQACSRRAKRTYVCSNLLDLRVRRDTSSFRKFTGATVAAVRQTLFRWLVARESRSLCLVLSAFPPPPPPSLGLSGKPSSAVEPRTPSPNPRARWKKNSSCPNCCPVTPIASSRTRRRKISSDEYLTVSIGRC